jgi:adenylyltransferase/sulfurtransferase
MYSKTVGIHDMANITTTEATTRYQRQVVLSALGIAGQQRLLAGRVLVVGVGGLGSWVAELLVRAGVGFLRLADDDVVELANLHRQALYGEAEAADHRPKVVAAATRLAALNRTVAVEPVAERADRFNLDRLARDVDLIIDGTDNFETRFLLNDYAVKYGKPWIFAGAVGTEAQTLTIVPGRTPCLRCILESPPSNCGTASCGEVGVLGPAVAAVAAFQAGEAIKLLSGHDEAANPSLLRFDLWRNEVQRLNFRELDEGKTSCICCVRHEYEFLEPCSALQFLLPRRRSDER